MSKILASHLGNSFKNYEFDMEWPKYESAAISKMQKKYCNELGTRHYGLHSSFNSTLVQLPFI